MSRRNNQVTFSLIAPIAALALLLVAALSAIVVSGMERQNAIAREGEETMAKSILSILQRQVERSAIDYAWWDEAARHLVVSRNADWVELNVEYSALETTEMEAVFVVDRAGRFTHFVAEGSAISKDDLPPAILAPLIAQAARVETDSSIAVSGALSINETLRLVSLAAISSERATTQRQLAALPRQFLGFVKKVSATELKDLGAGLSLRNLDFVETPQQDRGALQILAGDGAPIGFLTWRSQNPGTAFVSQLAPGIAITLAAGLLVFLVIARRVAAVAGRLQDREVVLAERNEELQASLQELEEASHAAQQADRAKTAFIATMSHEIRTPMNGILGMAQVLSQSGLNEAQKEQVDVILDSGSALMGILNDILDLSRIEAGQFEIHNAPLDVADLVAKCSAAWRSRFDEKGVQFDVAEQYGHVDELLGDQTRIRQVLNNLINNALKFTESGRVDLRVSTAADDGGVRLRAEVVDTGIGIAPELTHRLFQRFSQIDGSISRQFGGTGLGLAISKELVELMGGAIGCDSVLGKGSTFWFELPLARERQAPVVGVHVGGSTAA